MRNWKLTGGGFLGFGSGTPRKASKIDILIGLTVPSLRVWNTVKDMMGSKGNLDKTAFKVDDLLCKVEFSSCEKRGA
jgi:hypothetical protein